MKKLIVILVAVVALSSCVGLKAKYHGNRLIHHYDKYAQAPTGSRAEQKHFNKAFKHAHRYKKNMVKKNNAW